jgi:hypothetical protein
VRGQIIICAIEFTLESSKQQIKSKFRPIVVTNISIARGNIISIFDVVTEVVVKTSPARFVTIVKTRHLAIILVLICLCKKRDELGVSTVKD